MCYVQFK